MSSDPIEVLRELEAKLNRLEAKYREAIKGRDAADPLTNHRLGLSEGFGVAAMCVRDALASLSAPKPESAEAVIPWVREWKGSGPQRGFHIREATRLHNNRVVAYLGDQVDGAEVDKLIAEHNGKHPNGDPVRPAPPRPEASAPVGVEGVVKAMRMLAGVGIPVNPECVGRWADQLEALAQQPAAVDEAMVERGLAEYRRMGFVYDERQGIRKILTAALAGQQQGGES